MHDPLPSPLEAALGWAEVGVAVLPCDPGSKQPIGTLVPHGSKDATTDRNRIIRWWTLRPDAMVGIRLDSLIVVDLDLKPADGKDGYRVRDRLAEDGLLLPPTFCETTPSGGMHLYYAKPEGCPWNSRSCREGFDVLGAGYVIVTPSILADGGRYEVVPDCPRIIAEAPLRLIDFAQNREAAPKPTVQADEPAGAIANVGLRPLAASAADLQSPMAWAEDAESRLRSALKSLAARDRDVWFKVGAALHDLPKDDSRWAELVRRLWDEWSQSCPEKFDPAAQERTWESFGREYEGQRVTVATIYLWARETGWRDPAYPTTRSDADAVLGPSQSTGLNSNNALAGESLHQPFARLAATDAPEQSAIGLGLPTPKSGVDFASHERTDAGAALTFLDMFGENLRFIEKWGHWIVWDGARWAEASDIALLPLARLTTEEMIQWATAQPFGDNRAAWIKHALATQRDARLRAMVNLANGEPRARIEPDSIDADLWLLGCPNGTLDLRTGKLLEARREDLITKQIGAEFDPKADCPQWRGFVDWATQGDRAQAVFLQTFAGIVTPSRSPDAQNHSGDELPAARQGNGCRHLATTRNRSLQCHSSRGREDRRLSGKVPSPRVVRHPELGRRRADEMEARRAALARFSARGDGRISIGYRHRWAMDRRARRDGPGSDRIRQRLAQRLCKLDGTARASVPRAAVQRRTRKEGLRRV
jgi:hypothetical protein